MSLSKIVVSGRVIREPEKRFTPNSNVPVSEFAIAVESNPGPDGTAQSTPVKITTWRDLAERVSHEIKKGDLVIVDGRLQINNFTNSEGQKRREAEIQAISVENVANIANKQSHAGLEEATQSNQKVAAAVGRAPSNAEDLDAIFANEDEIPF